MSRTIAILVYTLLITVIHELSSSSISSFVFKVSPYQKRSVEVRPGVTGKIVSEISPSV